MESHEEMIVRFGGLIFVFVLGDVEQELWGQARMEFQEENWEATRGDDH